MISTEKLKLTIHYFEDVEDVVSPNSEIYGLIIEASFQWLKEPFLDFTTDALTLNWDGSIFNMDHFYYSSVFTDGVTGGGIFENYDAAAKVTSGGVGWYAKLPDNFVSYLRGGATIHLVPKTRLYVKNRPNMQISFNYAHQTIGTGVSFSVSPSGISSGVSFSGSYDEQGITAIYNNYEY